jgi:hypothetical protein
VRRPSHDPRQLGDPRVANRPAAPLAGEGCVQRALELLDQFALIGCGTSAIAPFAIPQTE